MAHSFRQTQLTNLSTAMTLMAWRWRQQWLLLLVTGLGTLAAMTLICSLPLFSSVMVTAGLRASLRASPDNPKIEAQMSLAGLSSATINSATGQLSALFQHDLSSYVNTSGNLSSQIEVPGWVMANTTNQVKLHMAAMSEAAHHLQMIQGQLPADTGSSTVLDVALTASAAKYMQVSVGSTFSLLGVAQTLVSSDQTEPQIYPQTLPLRVVGIFQTLPDDSYWHGLTFQEPAPPPHSNPVPFYLLTSTTPFLQWLDRLSQSYGVKGLSLAPSSTCFLTYSLVPTHINGARLDDLVNRIQQFQADVTGLGQTSRSSYDFAISTFPYITGVSISGATLHNPSGTDLLDNFQSEVLLAQATMLILTLQIAGLILFFISMLALTQVERQLPVLALLRSRGASGFQILATLSIQSLVLCLLAGCLAPFLAQILVMFSVPLLLPASTRDALAVLPGTFSALLAQNGLYALAALLVVLGTQCSAFIAALRGNVLALRREAARSTRRPLWLRLRLDLVLAVLALASYGFSLYTQETGQLLSTQSQQLILTPLGLLAPLLLILACMLFFLRLFPLLLQMLSLVIARRRGVASLLAVA